MLHADARQVVMAEQRFCRELNEAGIEICISHAACPDHAPDAESLLAYLKSDMKDEKKT